MFPRARRKMLLIYLVLTAILSAVQINAAPKAKINATYIDNFENDIDSDTEYEIRFNKKYGINPSWQIGNALNKNTHKYTMTNDDDSAKDANKTSVIYTVTDETINKFDLFEHDKEVNDSSVTTNKGIIIDEINKNTEQTRGNINSTKVEGNITTTRNTTLQVDLPVIPLSKMQDPASNITTVAPNFHIDMNNKSTISETVLMTDSPTTKNNLEFIIQNEPSIPHNHTERRNSEEVIDIDEAPLKTIHNANREVVNIYQGPARADDSEEVIEINDESIEYNRFENINKTKSNETETDDTAIPIYTELDYETDADVPEDYYDAKDAVPTKAPNTDALSVIVGLAGSVAESVAERVLPKGIFDLFKRMQKQSEAIEAERLRSREENGGLGQFGRGILKSISTGITRPFNQLMAGVRDIGSLDSDRGFVNGLASGVVGVADGVATVASSVSDAFKDRVQAIFPGTLWCGDGHSAAARSQDLGLFFLTDTCCRQHDACKQFIRAGETKLGLTNTGLFTRSHCSCDTNFRNCLKKTNSLVSSQIGLTYFNVLGPQCFRKAHPIVRCVKRTRLTGLKCEEYELDRGKPKMWQWFDNETF